MIEVRNLRKVYDNDFEALSQINFKINQGELACLLGPSGCGKTTVLNLIAGLITPTEGDILFDGQSVAQIEPKDRNIGYVFQNYALYPHLTVEQNVTFPLTVGTNKHSKSEALEIAQHYLELTNLQSLKNKKPQTLSGGQQQRVAIARALVQNPEVLLLDEPLSNLDARLRLSIREEIRRLVKEVGITTIFVTHDQEEALSISDQIILLNDGIVQQDAPPQELYLEPANHFSATFIGTPVINQLAFTYQEDYLQFDDFVVPVSDLVSERFRQSLVQGQDYYYLIRPENIMISEDTSSMQALSAHVNLCELIGRDQIIHLTMGTDRLRALTSVEQMVVEGQPLSIKLRHDQAYIFDLEGERVY